MPPSFSDYLVFVDESGDHGLASIDPNYPMFVLAHCLVSKDDYADVISPSIQKFKFKYFGHENVILHEHDIRKANYDFAFLQNTQRRNEFHSDLGTLIADSPFRLVASAIKKNDLTAAYSTPDNPYKLAMAFGLERIYLELHGRGCADGVTYIVYESRGTKEDLALELEFRRTCELNATGQRLPFNIILADKKSNSAGLQLADLLARPIGRHILDPDQPNRAYDILRTKFRTNPFGVLGGWGLKIFP